MATHRIHLRGPWDYSLHAAAVGVAPAVTKIGTANMPREWREVFEEIGGTAVFRRKFHRPTNLSPQERVVLVCTEVRGAGRASLNEHPLGEFTAEGNAVEFDVTGRLNSFNEFTIEIAFEPSQFPALSGGLYGVVAIEIRSADE
ncbi:glycoside hydrolase family 2 [Schlesneria paludicola]|uniref:glycoside hydrolase family 2 n=1 Tax=Schlesneria paludicola TaxID=360056 RepID=UPI00029A9FCE|nr:glycoside hydrolase family 2 [Schlesneria paludicola]